MSTAGLATLVDDWLDSTTSPNTRRARRTDIEAWLGWLATHGADALAASEADVAAYGQDLAGSAAGPNTVARRLSSVSSFYVHALARSMVATNPAASPPVSLEPWYRRSALDPLTVAQAKAFLAAADADRPRTAAIARLPLEVGLTTGQIAAAMIPDLRFPGGRRALAVQRSFGLQLVALSAPAAAALDDAIAGRTRGPILATRNDRPMAASQLFRAIQRAATRAKITEAVSPSLWRATLRAIALQAGASPTDIDVHMGLLPPPDSVPLGELLGRSPAHLVATVLEPGFRAPESPGRT